MATATRPPLGTRGWEVEWCESCPYIDDDEANGIDRDNAKMRRRVFFGDAAEQKARDFAREIHPQDFFGAVSITEVELIDPYGDEIPQTFYWEAVADSDFYEGDD